ncbi:MAG TPA: HAMP domain-containing sensor histidine kinase [Polyangiaceae bacterium]
MTWQPNERRAHAAALGNGAPKRIRRESHERPLHASPSSAQAPGGARSRHPRRRLADLYDIGRLFVDFQSVEQTAFASFAIVGRSVPLRSVILILEGENRPRTFMWPAAGVDVATLYGIRQDAWGTYSSLMDLPKRRPVVGPARALRQRRPTSFRRRAGDGPRDARHVLLPLVVGRRPIFGAIQFESSAPLDEADLMFTSAIVNQLALALDAHGASERTLWAPREASHALSDAIEAGDEHLELSPRLLADASKVMAELNPTSVLDALARCVVPSFADFCFFEEVASGAQRASRWLHRDEEKQALLDVVRCRVPALRAYSTVSAEALANEVAELLSEANDDSLSRFAISSEQLDLLRELDAGSILLVPLVHHGAKLGTLTFCKSADSARYSPADLALAQELGGRAARALHNAQLYARAQQESAAKDQVLATVSHELKSPVSSVVMCTEALLSASSVVDRDHLLQIIKRSGESILTLLGDLLDSASIQAGRLSVRLMPLDVATLVGDVLLGVEPVLATRSLSMRNLLDETLPRVLVDPGRIKQVFANLLSNAIKFTPDGGTISIRAKRLRDELWFAVEDSGVGVPEDDLPHLFERFWQAARTASIGSGLGLHIARGIVEAHGGRIWAESTLGVGTSVYLTLPIAGAAQTPGLAP